MELAKIKDSILKRSIDLGIEIHNIPNVNLGDSFLIQSKYNTLVKVVNYGKEDMELIPYFQVKDETLKYVFVDGKLLALSDRAESYINPTTKFLDLDKLKSENLDYYIDNRITHSVIGILTKVESIGLKNAVDFLEYIRSLENNVFKKIEDCPNYLSVIKCYDDISLRSMKNKLIELQRMSEDFLVFHTGIWEFTILSKSPVGNLVMNDSVFSFRSKPIEEHTVVYLQSLKSSLFQEIIDDFIEEENNIIKGYFKALHNKTDETYEHCERMRVLCITIGEELLLTPDEMETLQKMAIIHDIGKIAIEGKIINKPAKLDYDEFEIMKKHTVLGYEMLSGLKSYEKAREVCMLHHERWDGKGYPNGISGEEIPLLVRIVSVADAIDAMASKRVYKDPMTFEEIVKILDENQGKQFCPQVVKVVMDILPKIENLYSKFEHR